MAVLLIYAGIGLWVGMAFITWLLPRYDVSARGTSLGFKLLLLPGAVLLWPFVLLGLRRRV